MAIENHGLALQKTRDLCPAAKTDETRDGLEGTVRDHLERIMRSPHFDASSRSREFLRYVVDMSLEGRGGYLKQSTIAVDVFGRGPEFDAVIDPIVRVQAGRLRRSLERYYLLSGDDDEVRIELPKGSYAPIFVATSDAQPARTPPPEPARDWPTVVVNDFSTQSSPESAMAARVRSELATELGRYGVVRVALPEDQARSGQQRLNSARFELHGSARHLVGGPQVSIRLVDRVTGQQIWAEEFQVQSPGDSANTGHIGCKIAACIGADHGVISRLLAGEHAADGFQSSSAFGAIARAQHFLFSRQAGALMAAVEDLQALTRRAPEIELAWTSLARLYLINHSYELSSLYTPVEMAIGCANQSVLIEPANSRTRCLMATALLIKGELGAARRELDLALRLNPDSLACREVIGWLMALTGDWEPGVALMRAAAERNPYCHPCVSHGLWADALRRGDYEAAYASALEYREPTFFWRELMITSSLGHLGRLDDARAAAGELLRAKPQFPLRGSRLISHYIKADPLHATILEGLRLAGMEVA